MERSYVAHLIVHTHWDREWYSPFQTFRLRLVRLLDHVLDLLEAQPQLRFHLDGQTVPLLDYLEIRPEQEARLRRLIAAGRLLVGPWFVQPDELLPSGEALVRNLLLGQRIGRDFGRVMEFGYTPDSFGHSSQMPQLLRGFGIEAACWWRGLSGDEYRAELWWEAPDGSRVLLHKLPEYGGYSNTGALLPDEQAAVLELECIVRTEAERATTRHLLLMAGVDHAEPRDDLPRLVDLANATVPGAEFRLSTLEEYSRAVRAELAPERLATTRGEQRDTNRTRFGGGCILPNVLSSRIYNKLQNAAAQIALERWAEPCSALLGPLLGVPYPHGPLQLAWRWLLQNHAHDSIGGCSVDDVHAQMETRFQWAQTIADTLTDEQLDRLADQVDTSGLAEGEVAVLVFNALPWRRGETATLDLDLPFAALAPLPELAETPADYAGHHAEVFRRHAQRLWAPYGQPSDVYRGLRLRDLATGAELPVEAELLGPGYVSRNLRSGPNALERSYRVRARFRADDLPACGYRLLAARLTREPNRPAPGPRPASVLENEYLRAEIQPNGALTLLDRQTGERFTDLAYFEDGGDAGDGYTYSYPAFDRVITTLGAAPRISRLSAGPAVERCRIDYDLALPVGLTEDRRARRSETVTCPLSVVVSLGAGQRRLELEVTFDNRARDHRLRIVFPTDVRAIESQSDTPFDVVARPLRVRPVPADRWIEDPPTQHPQQTFVDVSDGRRGLAILSVGLPEYELVDDGRGAVKVTLLRAVGFLAGADEALQTIRGGAGPHLETPGGQVLRTLSYRLAVLPHAGSWAEAEVWREALAHAVPPRARTTLAHPGELPPTLGLLEVEGKNLVLSAVKGAEDGDGVVVRVYNPDRAPRSGWLRCVRAPARATRARLDETELEELAVEPDGRVPLELPSGRIETVRLRWAEHAS